jgi:hypothetical protein
LRNHGAALSDALIMYCARSLMKFTAWFPTHAVGWSDSFAYAYASPFHEFMSSSGQPVSGSTPLAALNHWW